MRKIIEVKQTNKKWIYNPWYTLWNRYRSVEKMCLFSNALSPIIRDLSFTLMRENTKAA